MRSIAVKIEGLWSPVSRLLDVLAPVADLIARIYVGHAFFISGMSKWQNWDTTLYLFQDEYQVPLLPPDVAAVIATAGELALPVMLIAGLFTRFSALGLFILNIVAVVSYYAALKSSAPALHDHMEWGIILALIMVTQVRLLTMDRLILRKWLG